MPKSTTWISATSPAAREKTTQPGEAKLQSPTPTNNLALVAEDKPSKTISTPTTREPGSASCSTETVLHMVPTERRKSLVPTKALKPSKRSPFVSFEVRTMM